MRARTRLISTMAALFLISLGALTAGAGDAAPTIKAKVSDFDPGAVIHVCWRHVPPGNPFPAKGPFDCSASIKAVDASFPGGGVNGDQIMSVVEKTVSLDRVVEVRIRGLEAGKPADDPAAGMMSVSRGASEFYNSYVARDDRDRLALFLDIEIKPEK